MNSSSNDDPTLLETLLLQALRATPPWLREPIQSGLDTSDTTFAEGEPLHHIGWSDALIAVVLSIAVFLPYFNASGWHQVIVTDMQMMNTYFNGDMQLVYRNMVSRTSEHYRNNVHPLFSLAMTPILLSVSLLEAVNPVTIVRFYTALVPALLAVSAYALFRVITLPKLDALIFTAVMLLSSAACFWCTVPETFAFGALSMLVVLIIVAYSQQRRLTDRLFVFAGLATASFTITNWVAGLSASAAAGTWAFHKRVTIWTIMLLFVLWCVQKAAYPTSGYLMDVRSETKYFKSPDISDLQAFIFSGILVPHLDLTLRPTQTNPNQRLPWIECRKGSAGPFATNDAWRKAGCLIWVLLLATGIRTAATMRHHRRLCLTLAVTCTSQLFIHMFYGNDPFLYSIHYVPLLVVACAIGSCGRARLAVRALATVLLVCCVQRNLPVYSEATEFLEQNHQTWQVAQRHGADG